MHLRAQLQEKVFQAGRPHLFADVMRSEASQDVTQPDKYPRAISIPPYSQDTKEHGIECVVKAVEWQMDMDRKISGVL